MNRQRAPCPCCGADDTTRIGSLPSSTTFAGRPVAPIPGGDLYRCKACSLKFRFPTLGEAEYSALYNNQLESAWPLDDRRNDWPLLLASIEGLKPRGGDVLDFGCNTGQLLGKLDSRYARHGVEVNEAAASLARSGARATVWHDLNQLPPGRRFDVIIAADTIEHFPEPLRILSRLLDMLSDDGVLLLTTGDAECPHWDRLRSNWWYCAFPEHVAFISGKWLRFFSNRLGYTIIKYTTFRYARMSPFQRLCGYAAIYAYGISPRGYHFARDLARMATGRGRSERIPGASVTRDHFLAALSREGT